MTSTRAAVAVLAMGALVVTLGFANTGAAGRGCDRRGHDGAPGAFIEENAARLGLDPEKTGLILFRFEASHGKLQVMK